MAEISKQGLSVLNGINFPDNNTGYITPEKLRTFNQDMIDSTVNQTVYDNTQANLNAFTASITASVQELLNLSSSLSGGYVTQGELADATGSLINYVNTYTASANSRLANLESTSASLLIETSNLESFTASANVRLTNIEGFTSSANIRLTNLETTSASVNVSIANINNFTQSVSPTGTGSLLVTSSYDGVNLTFTKGNGTTYRNDGLQSTASFNSYTQSVSASFAIINAATASFAVLTNPSIQTISSSVLITANSFTSGAASISNYTSSVNNANLLFKTNDQNAVTIISGSGNLLQSPAAPTAGFVRFVGGTGNMYLGGAIPSLTASAASISGNRPAMTGNIIPATHAMTINQSPTPGIWAISSNILAGIGATAINALGNTGPVTFSNNIGQSPTITINSPSRSLAEINAGASGSNSITITSNNVAGTLAYNGPVSSSVHTISNNTITFGANLTANLQSGSRGYTIAGNLVQGAFAINDNTAFVPNLGTNNLINGNLVNTLTLNNRTSASFTVSNNIINAIGISSDLDTSAVTPSGFRSAGVSNNLFLAALSNVYFSGSMGAVGIGRAIGTSVIAGINISASLVGDGVNRNIFATTVMGAGLNISGTSGQPTTGLQQNIGSAFFGRWNSDTGNRASTAETIFAVGTGVSSSVGITRKTGFLIDSGSNTFVEGTLNVSGATTINGNTIITGSLTLSSSAAIELDIIGNTQLTGSLSISGSTTLTGSVYGNVTALTITSLTASMDLSRGNFFTLTLAAGANHLDATNIRPGQTVSLLVTNDATGTGTLTLAPGKFRQPIGFSYVASPSGSAQDILTFATFASTTSIYTLNAKQFV